MKKIDPQNFWQVWLVIENLVVRFFDTDIDWKCADKGVAVNTRVVKYTLEYSTQ